MTDSVFRYDLDIGSILLHTYNKNHLFQLSKVSKCLYSVLQVQGYFMGFILSDKSLKVKVKMHHN